MGWPAHPPLEMGWGSVISGVHEVFHICMLQKYIPNPADVVDLGEIEVSTDGTFEEGPVCIMDSREGFVTQGREASKGIMATPWIGGGNVGA